MVIIGKMSFGFGKVGFELTEMGFVSFLIKDTACWGGDGKIYCYVQSG